MDVLYAGCRDLRRVGNCLAHCKRGKREAIFYNDLACRTMNSS